jgi:Uma2 family endonuclease
LPSVPKFEADNSYWIANELKVPKKRRPNLKVDPPPDLAIEVDLTSSSLNRMDIYAALQVPEVWRLDGDSLNSSFSSKTANITRGTVVPSLD